MTAVTRRRDGHHNQVAEGPLFRDQFLALDELSVQKKAQAFQIPSASADGVSVLS